MYSREYLESCEKQAVTVKIDAFLAGLTEYDRVYALAVLRERHTVYKDSSSRALSQGEHFLPQFQQQLMNRQRALDSSLGNVLSRVFPF